MADVTIWHNPRCSKSRAALALLQESGVEPEIRRYLDAPPSAEELRRVLAALGTGPGEIIRRGEAAFKELKLADADDAALIAAMAEHPILIERPLVIRGERAVIGRPPERVRELL